MKISNLSGLAKLEMFRVALINAQKNVAISKLLLSVGFTPDAIEEGNSLFILARKAFDEAKLARLKRSEAYKSFMTKMTVFENQFFVDLKKAKAVFIKDILAQEKLGLNAGIPANFVKRLEVAKTFYQGLNSDPELAAQLTKYNLSPDDITAAVAALTAVEQARADYISEKGNSQDATNAKSKAMDEVSDWMIIFYKLAQVALRRQPQLMEALNVVVKN